MPGKHEYLLQVLSGKAIGIGPACTRLGLRLLEPLYAGIMRTRNRLYNTGIFKAHDLGRPTISVGNITTGGTGKTPMVRWLAEQLMAMGQRPAILMRGYKRTGDGPGDEQAMLQQMLPAVPVIANPSRVAGARQALSQYRQITIFLLDDGFQHRAARRDFDLVLINAVEPFGFGHVLPRGLLREPLAGLRRADAIVLTRSDQVPPEHLRALREQISRICPATPIYSARHVLQGLQTEAGPRGLSELRGRRYWGLCGIADPESFRRQLAAVGGECMGWWSFPDHHAYGPEELANVFRQAQEAGAELMVTTEKDWVKLSGLAKRGPVPTWRVQVSIEWGADEGARFIEQFLKKTETAGHSAAHQASHPPETIA